MTHYDLPSFTNAGILILGATIVVALLCAIVMLARVLHRPKCHDCGMHIPGWHRPSDFGILNIDTMMVAPLCKFCFINRASEDDSQK